MLQHKKEIKNPIFYKFHKFNCSDSTFIDLTTRSDILSPSEISPQRRGEFTEYFEQLLLTLGILRFKLVIPVYYINTNILK